jgi:hypothetical protein
VHPSREKREEGEEEGGEERKRVEREGLSG